MRKDEDGFILIDVPEPLKTADAQSYAASADAVLVVMRHRTKTSQARRVLAEFDAVSAPILGAVMVKVDERGGDAKAQPQFSALESGRDPLAIGPGRTAVPVEDLELRDYTGMQAGAARSNGSGATAVSPAARRVNRMRSRRPRG